MGPFPGRPSRSLDQPAGERVPTDRDQIERPPPIRTSDGGRRMVVGCDLVDYDCSDRVGARNQVNPRPADRLPRSEVGGRDGVQEVPIRIRKTNTTDEPPREYDLRPRVARQTVEIPALVTARSRKHLRPPDPVEHQEVVLPPQLAFERNAELARRVSRRGRSAIVIPGAEWIEPVGGEFQLDADELAQLRIGFFDKRGVFEAGSVVFGIHQNGEADGVEISHEETSGWRVQPVRPGASDSRL